LYSLFQPEVTLVLYILSVLNQYNWSITVSCC